ncbi:aspartate/glutamate racemase family protein [Sulfitobacter sp. SK011]|uniref:maleate cis-trans isomerase family protein n=1 Tax=Sulfitobacter sp. SK011 TaxID=1389004 RepID=UPI000E0AD2C2|nr:aspartate/glutamate racemase family protein [Sulfitobacter sp. SK011]AXI44540.1 Asp/Glu/hydantoin racemase [Sulfitobacter sp. SK011]
MTNRTLIGVLTPSSNTVLEPLTSAMLAGVENVSAHFGRFRVTEISTSENSDAQFRLEPQLAAADLLADAHVDAIVWSGTSASWLGFDKDLDMCRAIEDRTGIKAGSAVLAINELFAGIEARTFGLVSPYVGEIQDMIVENYATAGLNCVAERHLNETVNFNFSNFSEAEIETMIREVAEAKPDAITVMCTNMRGARIVPQLEQELGIPIFDSTAAALWSGMRLSGSDPAAVNGWGRVFDL